MAFETTVRALMDLEDIMLSGTSQTEAQPILYDFIYVESENKSRNTTEQEEPYRQRKNKWL